MAESFSSRNANSQAYLSRKGTRSSHRKARRARLNSARLFVDAPTRKPPTRSARLSNTSGRKGRTIQTFKPSHDSHAHRQWRKSSGFIRKSSMTIRGWRGSLGAEHTGYFALTPGSEKSSIPMKPSNTCFSITAASGLLPTPAVFSMDGMWTDAPGRVIETTNRSLHPTAMPFQPARSNHSSTLRDHP